MSEPPNPIIAAIARSSMARSSRVKSPRGLGINFGCDTFSPPMRSWVRHCFDAKTRDEIGTLFLCAFANGDDRIVEIVRDVRKAADHLFHRNHEPTLLRQTVAMISEQCGVEIDDDGKPVINIEKIKREVESRHYNGKPLAQYRWTRVRNALNWPKRATGAAAASYPRKPKRKRRRRR